VWLRRSWRRVWVDGGDGGDGVRLKPPLVMRNPPSRVRILVRVGGLCNMSDDFNRAVFDISQCSFVKNLQLEAS
jgi:hypothetical protein